MNMELRLGHVESLEKAIFRLLLHVLVCRISGRVKR